MDLRISRPRRIHWNHQSVLEQLRTKLREAAYPSCSRTPRGRTIPAGMVEREGDSATSSVRWRGDRTYARLRRSEPLDKRHEAIRHLRRDRIGRQRDAAHG